MAIIQKLELPEGIQLIDIELIDKYKDGTGFHYGVRIRADYSLYDQLVEADEKFFYSDDEDHKANMHLMWHTVSSLGILEVYYVTGFP